MLERRYSGAGSSSRNIGRVRAMQLTPELARFAIAAQEKHARLSDELGANTLFWRPGYALLLYEAGELALMREVHDMLRREFALRTELLDGPATLRRLPILSGGEPPLGALIHADASVHHDAVMFAYRAACRRAAPQSTGSLYRFHLSSSKKFRRTPQRIHHLRRAKSRDMIFLSSQK